MRNPDKKTVIRQDNLVLFSISLLIVLFTFRGILSEWKYLFVAVYASLVVYTIIVKGRCLLPCLINFLKTFAFTFFILIILIAVYLLSYKQYLLVFKEILNTVVLLTLFFFLKIHITETKDLKIFFRSLMYLIFLSAIFISFQNLSKILNINGVDFGFNVSTPFGQSEKMYEVDYNFILLPVFFAIIIILRFLYVKKGKFSIPLTITSLLFSLCIFLSGSRRGLIIFTILLITLFSIQLISGFLKKKEVQDFARVSRFYTLSVIFSIIAAVFIVVSTPYSFKNNILRVAGSSNILVAKENIASVALRYAGIFTDKLSFSEVYNLLWTPVFVPEDPESSWGTKIHHTVYHLDGKNVEIVPPGSMGYKLDKTTQSMMSNGHAYSNTKIGKFKVDRHARLVASVYCFVSDDFDGNWVSISASGSVTGNVYNQYDLSRKGEWQKLSIELLCSDSTADVYLNMAKNHVPDLSSLSGFVIFSYPTVDIITDGKQSFVLCKHLNKNHLNKIKCLTTQSYNKADLYPFSLSAKITSLQQKDDDLVRNFLSEIISEDSTFRPMHARIIPDRSIANFSESRFLRFKFALKIFNEEYNLGNKLIGGGFAFLNWYGDYFYADQTRSDYPHNPFLHVLLYSGLIGLLIYSIFLYKVFYYYFVYKKEYQLIFIFFLITFIFTFFSGGTPFDPPLMGFFLMLPFFIHSVHK